VGPLDGRNAAIADTRISTNENSTHRLRPQNQRVSFSPMSIWEKLITSPDLGPRTGSPLVRAALGLLALNFALHTIYYGAVALNKSAPYRYIYFADHPIVVSLLCICALLAAAWGLTDARARYLMHDR